MNEDSKEARRYYKKKIILSTLSIVFSLFILFLIYSLFANFGANPVVVILSISFVLLLFLGPFFRRNRKGMYSEMFPGKSKTLIDRDRFKPTGLSKKSESYEEITKRLNYIDLDFKPEKPLIRKCQNCKMIVANFVKKCPKCGEFIND